ncbi:ABC transporter substrate-binding protein [Hyphomicrobium methylovorum]|uniref:extracellular solute-binding protein n=1 Tax=Hyphomicrobium methylovorum TaxID=84 RepID=UPI0015E6A6BD|nr:extracellular solute-binding protein [Hyphomicrobium methylovorum]MBA2127806.1 ABC transporter substrate-binding protein [Hyphomicrobium methylovorum]
MSLGKISRAIFLAAILSAVSTAALAEPRHAIALHGEPLFGEDFRAFPYVNPDAPKGGRLTLGVLGSFENLNPLIVQGVAAAGVREFSVESLMARSLEEPFTLYGLLAKTIDVASDHKSVTFEIDPRARFSDNTPVTPADVITSFELLKAKGRPNHRTYFEKVTKAEVIDNGKVRFTFEDANDRELPLILGLMPVFAAHATSPEKFEASSMTPLVGSGPYTISRVDAGRSLTYTRNPDYWGRDLPVSRGRFNFDEVKFDYFRDASVMMEAFKSGALDLRLEEDPGRWADAYGIPAVRDGRIIKAEFPIGLPAGMTALVFNTRRPVFADPRVRRALMTLFDFEWTNRTLYNGLFKRTESYFERSELASTGRPADDYEKKILAPYPDAVRPEFLDGTYRFPVTDGSGQNRANQKVAFALLREAGMVMKNGRLVDGKTQQPLSFEILANSNAQEALLLSYARSLEPLGIRARVRVVDSAQYQQRLASYDYDMIQNSWPSSLSPGNEQLFRWSAKTADTKGSFNFAGVKNPAADAMIAAMLAAETQGDFVSSVRALDRVLLSGDYVVPLFFMPRQWVAYWARLGHPEKTPLFGYSVDTWWFEKK